MKFIATIDNKQVKISLTEAKLLVTTAMKQGYKRTVCLHTGKTRMVLNTVACFRYFELNLVR